MIALRLAGCAFVLAAAFLWCAHDAAVCDGVIEGYARVLRFIDLVRREIEFYETPFPQIAAKFCERENISASGGADSADAVGEALFSALAEADAARFLSFYEALGGGFSETELRSCDEASLYFKDRLAALREELGRKKRVRSALTLFVAATLCVLVI